MRVVDGEIDALLTGPRHHQGLVGMHGVHVGVHRLVVATHPGIDVRRHVYQCPAAGISDASRSAHGTASAGFTFSTAWM